jgi:ribosome-associated protein
MVEIPNSELQVVFSRAGGPGGQNVNRRESRVQIRFAINESAALSPEQKSIILNHPLVRSRLIDGDVLQFAVDTHRKQRSNLEEAVIRLHQFLERALKPKRKRLRTKTPKSAVRRRLAEKKMRADTKSQRRSSRKVVDER